MTETRRLKSTLVTWISLLGIGAAIVIALILSLSPPRGPQTLEQASLAISSDPDPPRLGLNRIQVRLATTDGMPISDALVELKYGRDARAPLTFTRAHASGEGVYRANVEFDAPGPWQVILTLKREGAPDLSRTYRYDVIPSSQGSRVLDGTVRIVKPLTRTVAQGPSNVCSG